jgi:hypothetical protein
MSRFSGPQQRGAGQQLAAQRRREAETRQATERNRDARRAADAAAPPRLLTDDERAELVHAVNALEIAHVVRDLNRLWGVA